MCDRVIVGGVEVNPLAVACAFSRPEVRPDGKQFVHEVWFERDGLAYEMSQTAECLMTDLDSVRREGDYSVFRGTSEGVVRS